MTQYYLRKTKKVAVCWYSGENLEETRTFIGNGDVTVDVDSARVITIRYKGGFMRTVPPARYLVKGDHKTFWCLSLEAFHRQYTRYFDHADKMDMATAFRMLHEKGEGCVYRDCWDVIRYYLENDRIITTYKGGIIDSMPTPLADLINDDWRYSIR